MLVGLEAESLADADVLMTCVAIYLIDPKEWIAAALRKKRKSDPSTMTFEVAEREAERDSKLRTALRRKLRRAPPPGERSSQAAK